MPALCSLPQLKQFLGVSFADTTKDVQLTALSEAASRIIRTYLGQNVFLTNYVEFYAGNGRRELPLRQRPVVAASRVGTITTSSAVVSGLSATSDLAAGMAVSGTGIPANAVILSIDSATTVTLSLPATDAGTPRLLFGLAVWVDFDGRYAANPDGPFADNFLLVAGTDYALDLDRSGTASHSGLLIRIGGVWQQTALMRITGEITPSVLPSYGSIRVAYTAGYAPGKIPYDIQYATCLLTSYLRRTIKSGSHLHSERLGDYSYELLPPRWDKSNIPELGEIRGLLARYKDVSF